MNQRENYMSGVTNYEYYELSMLDLYTFLFEDFCFLQMLGDPRATTFDHSARIRPAIPGLQVLISWFSTTSYKDLSQV
jgi:hypothetical protein